MSGPKYLVVPEAVQPLSLVIHELAVNAVTHGALSRHGHGRLAIAWEPTPEDGRLIVIWTESGSAPRPQVLIKGFGTIIVGALIEKQLRGSITRDWRDGSLAVTLEIRPG